MARGARSPGVLVTARRRRGKERGFNWGISGRQCGSWHQLLLLPRISLQCRARRKSFSIVMLDTPNRMRVKILPKWLFLNRVQWGLNAVLAQLGAAGRRARSSKTSPRRSSRHDIAGGRTGSSDAQ